MRLACGVGPLLLAMSAAQAQNQIANGDFSMGATGFSTDYHLKSSGAVYAQDACVAANTNICHILALSFGDHTTGTGLMLCLNGAANPSAAVWEQTIPVTPFTDHAFSGWVMSWGNTNGFDPNPALLRLEINGALAGPDFAADPQNGLWTEWTAFWNSGTASFATIRITDLETHAYGNDFSIDDLSLVSGVPPQGALGGSVNGLVPRVGKVLCKNQTTHQEVRITVPAGATAWDCVSAGLVVHTGDQVRILVTFAGTAE